MAGDGLEFRLIRADDVGPAVALMRRIGVHFGGNRSTTVLRSVARDGVAFPDEVRIALASSDGAPAGLVIALTERSRYWRKFIVRHPFGAFRLGSHRLARILRRRSLGPQAPATDRARDARKLVEDRLVSPGNERWGDERATIAKVMYVAVDPAHRQGGIGTRLYRWFFRDLHAAGFERCDAHVSSENVAALTLHRRFPFRFIEVRGGYFLWLLPHEVAET